MAKKSPKYEGLAILYNIIMNYHDFIWDLGGTYWIAENIHKCLCSDIGELSHQADHDSVLCSIRNLNTGCNSNLYSYFQFSYRYKKKKKPWACKSRSVWGSKELPKIQHRDAFLVSHRDHEFLTLWEQNHCTLLYGDCNGRREPRSRPASICFIWRKNMVFKTVWCRSSESI